MTNFIYFLVFGYDFKFEFPYAFVLRILLKQFNKYLEGGLLINYYISMVSDFVKIRLWVMCGWMYDLNEVRFELINQWQR